MIGRNRIATGEHGQYFGATLGGRAKAVTTSANVILCGVLVFVGLLVGLTRVPTVVTTALAALVLAIAVVILARRAPNGYCIVDRCIRIRRSVGDVVIPVSDVKSVRQCSFDEVWKDAGKLNAGTYRGSWGLFGGYTMHGDFYAYVTDHESMVVIHRSKDVPVVISPDHPDEFVSAVSALM